MVLRRRKLQETIQDRTGIVAVGATPWIVNFNVLLDSSDLSLGASVIPPPTSIGCSCLDDGSLWTDRGRK